MKTTTLKGILDILSEYDEFQTGDICAEHDEIYISGPNYAKPYDSKVNAHDVVLLESLGCIWNDEFECWHVFT